MQQVSRLALRVADAFLGRVEAAAEKADLPSLRAKLGLSGDRVMELHFIDADRSWLLGLTETSFRRLPDGAAEPHVRVEVARVWDALDCAEGKVSPLVLQRLGKLRWEYRRDHRLNSFHRDALVLDAVFKQFRADLARGGG